jgi:D-beta-D-heptose 7-phosphate kinase/D-beta-D-heptose 1-phosphate adenosyltransferase
MKRHYNQELHIRRILHQSIPSFQDEEFRIKVLESIKYVDKVLLSIDLDSTVVQSIETAYYLIKQQDKDAEIIFTKGGDRFANEIPESSICNKLGIKIIDSLGEKIYHSSNIIKI